MSGCLSRGVTFCAGDRLTVIGVAALKTTIERYTTNPRDLADLLRDLSRMEDPALVAAIPALSDVAMALYMQATRLDPESGYVLDRGDGSVPVRRYFRESDRLIAGPLFDDLVRLTPGMAEAIDQLKACRHARAEPACEAETAEAPPPSREHLSKPVEADRAPAPLDLKFPELERLLPKSEPQHDQMGDRFGPPGPGGVRR